MKTTRAVSMLFVVAALYDGLLGLVFLFAPLAAYDYFGVAHPNHLGYVHFPATLLLVFTVMFLAIAARPVANRNLIPYGILLKAAYCGVVGWHWLATGIPNMWKPFAIGDVLFAILFAWSYIALGKASRAHF
jgi:hypothetical protein